MYVPFVFSANGRPHHKDLVDSSGIWFLDGRHSANGPKSLQDFYSPKGLENLFKQDIQKATQKLQNEPFDYLTDKINGLGLRPYQVKAIQAVEQKIAQNPEKSTALLTMATGTGKTRTILGLAYRLVKAQRFKRILFLTDRRVLNEQAFDTFSGTKIEKLQTFAQIYELKDMSHKFPEEITKVHFATVQGMYYRIFNTEENAEKPTIDAYDCIIVDEAHRGYNLDREISDEDIEFKNKHDYRSKYHTTIEYFDAFRIGLTATPALHTTEIFGEAVYSYSYNQAVLDGYLIPYDTPHQIETELNTDRIHWDKGAEIQFYDPNTKEVLPTEKLPDELNFEISNFNQTVKTENFNRTVSHLFER